MSNRCGVTGRCGMPDTRANCLHLRATNALARASATLVIKNGQRRIWRDRLSAPMNVDK